MEKSLRALEQGLGRNQKTRVLEQALGSLKILDLGLLTLQVDKAIPALFPL